MSVEFAEITISALEENGKSGRAVAHVLKELQSATEKFGEFNTPHEGYAVLLEEVDELWDEIKGNKRDPYGYRRRQEVIQVAAMALRFLIDVCPVDPCPHSWAEPVSSAEGIHFRMKLVCRHCGEEVRK